MPDDPTPDDLTPDDSTPDDPARDSGRQSDHRVGDIVSGRVAREELDPETITQLAAWFGAPAQSIVNTAPVAVLAALESGLDASSFAALEGLTLAFEDVAEFTEATGQLTGAASLLTVESQYFRINVHAQVGQAVTILSSLAYRDPQSQRVSIRQRDFGRDFTSRLKLATTTE